MNIKYHRGANSTEYTVVELKALAKSKNYKGYSKMTKEELCNLLNIRYVESFNAHLKSLKASKPKKGILVPCNSRNPSYPCKLKRGIFKDQQEWDEYIKLKRATRVKNPLNRSDAVKLANIELAKQKDILKDKKTPVKRVRFYSPTNIKNIK